MTIISPKIIFGFKSIQVGMSKSEALVYSYEIQYKIIITVRIKILLNQPFGVEWPQSVASLVQHFNLGNYSVVFYFSSLHYLQN